jgi:hypothetical protein
MVPTHPVLMTRCLPNGPYTGSSEHDVVSRIGSNQSKDLVEISHASCKNYLLGADRFHGFEVVVQMSSHGHSQADGTGVSFSISAEFLVELVLDTDLIIVSFLIKRRARCC